MSCVLFLVRKKVLFVYLTWVNCILARDVFLGELSKRSESLGELYTKYVYPWASKGQDLW